MMGTVQCAKKTHLCRLCARVKLTWLRIFLRVSAFFDMRASETGEKLKMQVFFFLDFLSCFFNVFNLRAREIHLFEKKYDSCAREGANNNVAFCARTGLPPLCFVTHFVTRGV